MKTTIISILILLLYCGASHGTDYSQDANCQQCFVLDDGDADVTDRAGSNDLTLANGTWAGSNDGYIFDSDATGSFTPGFTEWLSVDSTLMALATFPDEQEKIIYSADNTGDWEKRMNLTTDSSVPYGRAKVAYGMNYSPQIIRLDAADENTAKQWVTVTVDWSETLATLYEDGVSQDTDTVFEAYQTTAFNRGRLGSGSTSTIYQVGVFNRILSSVEITEIIADGFIGAAVGGWTHKWNGVAAANMAKINSVTKANIAKVNGV